MSIISDLAPLAKQSIRQPAGGLPASTATARQVEARFEQAILDPGVKLVYRTSGNQVRIGYDPEQINALDARLLTNIFVNYTEGEKLDKLVELARAAETPTIRQIFTILLDQIDENGDPDGTLRAAEKVFTRVVKEDRGAPRASCSRYSWCVETDEKHVEHTGDSIEPTFLETDRRELLTAGLTHWSKGIRVGFLEQDLTPADARTNLAELRAHLDAVEKLIEAAEVTA
ncbi:hypothetical protein ACFU51_04825 [Streptomyces sp. NPDC057430]|uniref:hypothetical protein n=1 Tax=Streptomyces sp. NPDC057430 TaxID=3346131 RepID=UPI0036BF87E6